ncbi:rhamnogalacturonan acetylesterase [Klebsiella indica]|uniref:Rhamnogalacturonan acetylesterase n=2 Tax=Enterobacterales TaxID=91347 RepID=A0A5R9LIR7_9ENTR|nr:rhamnogalacturonan acetylesterase [Klebsiella indica]TLV19162.1 rhamnogalacturonan acetylesterase [Klebsiella indica]
MNTPMKLLALLCTFATTAQASTLLQGVVLAETPFRGAQVNIVDSNGMKLSTQTDNTGRYSLVIDSLRPPLALSAKAAGTATDCLHNDKLRARCMASLLLSVKKDSANTANITPFSDRLVSEVAGELGYIGPQQWIEQGRPADLRPELLTAPLTNFRRGMEKAFIALGTESARIDPIKTPIIPGDAMTTVLSVINHNRGYDNNSGEAGTAILTDSAFRPIVGLKNSGPWEPFDLNQALQDKARIATATKRILIVSDSTAATYEVSRLPRMGWGQVFQNRFLADSGVVVLNGARAGRSSRDFYNEGWYQQMGRYLQPGDYVFIAHGHNDQNCNGNKPIRGAADVRNLCTYPNDANGKPQYPQGHPELSFQHSLERYIKIARDKGAIPVLFTPTTRVKNAAGKTAFQHGPQDVVVSSHHTQSNPGYLFSGDYIATIKQTAERNQVPLIDLEQATIDFANAHPNDWMDYWLAVDANDPRYPWYKTQKSGIRTHPDTTHFQQKGAEAVAEIVARRIRQTPQLQELANKLYP